MALRVGAETLLFGVPEDTQRQLLAAPQVGVLCEPRLSPNLRRRTLCPLWSSCLTKLHSLTMYRRTHCSEALP